MTCGVFIDEVSARLRKKTATNSFSKITVIMTRVYGRPIKTLDFWFIYSFNCN